MAELMQLSARVPAEAAGRRLDQVLAELFPDYSRSRLQHWVRAGAVQVDGRAWTRPRDKLAGGEQVEITASLPEDRRCEAQDIPLQIVHEDAELLVIDKPAGLVVHPAAGNPDGTLQNALLHHDPALAAVPRAGIVHRLDKDTSGLMVVARTLTAHHSLVAQLQARSVSREYLAVVWGVMTAGGSVEQPIGRHPVDRKRMAVLRHGGKPAVTHYRVAERFRAHSLLRVSLETGRTHQIRVHMAWLRHPLVGDPVYGGRQRQPAGAGEALRQTLHGFRRQALHATRLVLDHPASGETMAWEAPPPADFQALLAALREDAAG
ncbi:23S rRNA pseudouridine(1911/1915/1917) synthase RluD [Thiohalobacter sp. IOR34]|uniref:23S rRNA pseudouridine(1911/1915/1917) synthase RluD n=1 Tax=Thiohalobacter sp. IOR34 TaxID=3057176 RepID=UPI0025B1F173|nr:23S rRNA pseudouridine(1911/1915/1917) synthase RluD [Thiohalobacter sp. IOR34]WJW74923.1 23S rRNA pseudouridine(1911/1915/1917) synthase RluD [Thiohalobacter sp. IOR34]